MANKLRECVILTGMMLILAVIFGKSGCKQKTEVQNDPNNGPPSASDPQSRSIKEIIGSKHYWTAIMPSWYGKEAPDFTLADTQGKQHKLSDYRGKNVIVVIWATWCPPCKAEIPHLIELQNTMGKEKLAILGISFFDPMNSLETIKNFATQNSKINYPLLPADASLVPAPYPMVEYLPSSFFIDPEGKFKLITNGPTMLGDLRAIVMAKTR
ncbi:MAG: TlpA family protein disulfide reductase [Candidatus Brocadiia bacterium]|nr:MAG: TlpA family protein disulfide reductase [Candidatus Brocadiia bacterium]